jgi:predicted nucleotidyltransferase
MDVPSFLACLNDHGVDYVLIGALAFPHHGYARATLDVDVFIEPTAENAARTRSALKAFGFDVCDLGEEDLLRYKVLVRDYSLQVDVHPFVAGADYEAVRSGSVETRVGGVPVRVPSLAHVIDMKRASGRPKDLEDLRHLEALSPHTTD